MLHLKPEEGAVKGTYIVHCESNHTPSTFSKFQLHVLGFFNGVLCGKVHYPEMEVSDWRFVILFYT